MAQATFEEISASDFFYRNRDIAGFTNPSRAIFAAIRELVENSLDAAESQKIPPEIYIRLSFEGEATKDTQIYKLRVEDNGSGIQPRFIPITASRRFNRILIDKSPKKLINLTGPSSWTALSMD